MPPLRSVTAASALICLCAIFFILWTYSTSDAAPPPPGQLPPGTDPAYGWEPFVAPWTSWFQPGAWAGARYPAHNAGRISKDWNILYHLGGNGPWVQKIDGIVTNDLAPPEGCEIQQVHMISRHGERYPTQGSGRRMMDTVAKIKNISADFTGDFAFLNDWEFWVDDAASELEQLTLTGPYAGGLDSFTTGVKFRSRYPHLVKSQKDRKVKLWASGSDRVEASARYFTLGLFGLEANQSSSVEVISELGSRGGDTLTPADTCSRYQQDEIYGHDSGDIHLAEFQERYLAPVEERIVKELLSMVRSRKKPALSFTMEEMFSMQEMCGYETSARGTSPWCDVFTRDEWESFEYARDIMHFYRSGPGNKWGPVLGTLWLNATAQLMAAGPSAGPFFFSFSHDSDIIPVLATMKLMDDGPRLPTDRVMRDRKWRTSQVVPMGGRIMLERMMCDSSAYVRLNINDGLVAIPGCIDGPNLSCSLPRFLKYLDDKIAAAGDFKAKCGLQPDAPGYITFLHQ